MVERSQAEVFAYSKKIRSKSTTKALLVFPKTPPMIWWSEVRPMSYKAKDLFCSMLTLKTRQSEGDQP